MRIPQPALNWTAAAVIVLLGVVCGCAGVQVGGQGARIVLPPTTIVGDPKHIKSDIYDAYELFDRAGKAFEADDWAAAEHNYLKLINEYPDSELIALARYNLGLVYERNNRWAAALENYREFPSPLGNEVRLEEVRMRRGICLVRLGRYDDARREFEAILQQFGVPALEHNETRVRLGVVYYYLQDDILAQHYLEPALETYAENVEHGVRHATAAYAEGYFVMGEIAYHRFLLVQLPGPGDALAQALHDKAQTLIEAREYYTRAIRTYQPTWMIASLLRVGMCYEILHAAMLAVPEPPELTAEQRVEYHNQLTTKIRPLLDKAMQAYRRNLELAADFKMADHWVDETRSRYEALLKRTE